MVIVAARSANTTTVLLGREKPSTLAPHKLTLPSPSPLFLMFYSWTHGNLSVCWGAFSKRVNRSSSLSLCVQTWEFTSSASPSPPLAPWKSRSTPQGQHNKRRWGAGVREQRALQPCEKLVLEKGVNPEAVPVQGLKKNTRKAEQNWR